MKKKLFLILLWTLLGAAISFAGWFVSNFYILFSNSDEIFAWKHTFMPELIFHTDQWGYQAGDSIQIFASWRGGDSVEVRLSDILQKNTIYKKKIWVRHQSVRPGVAVRGTGWKKTHSIGIDSSFPTGWYVLSLKKGGDSFHQSIFVQPSIPAKKVAILFSTNTWNAYNFWGGHSIYSKNHTDSVSFFRPQLVANPFLKNTYPNHQLYFQGANKDRYLAEMLDSADFAFDAYSMEDLESAKPQLFEYKAWILSTHTEYWSRNMLAHLNTYLDSGGSLVNLAGNVAAYESFVDVERRQLKVHRAIENLWEERDSTGLRPFGMTPGFLGFHTYAPYRVVEETSWMLEGSGLKNGDLLGEISDSYDYTYMYGGWWRRLWGLRKKGKMGAASGLEIDQLYEGTPANWRTVAEGLNPRLDGQGEVFPEKINVPWKSGEGGYIGYYEHPGGGLVFGVGSMAFTGALPFDRDLRKIVLNVLERVASKSGL